MAELKSGKIHSPTRRHVLKTIAHAVGISLAAPCIFRATAQTTSLKALGAARGLAIGTAFGGQDWSYSQLLVEQVSLITPEWSLKPGFLKPSQEAAYRFETTDAIWAFCTKNRLSMHGHTLFWHADPLAWAAEHGEGFAKRSYRQFLAAVIDRYRGVISWDVANEIISDKQGELLRNAPFLSRFGLDFVVDLYREVGRLASGRTLVLNDYNLECGKDWCARKQVRFLSVLDALLDAGAPIGAVGMQGHLSSRHGIDIEGTLGFIDEIARRGLNVHISELDVNDVAFAEEPSRRDQQVAALYADYLNGILVHPAIKRVVFWGLSDRDHWLVRDRIDDGRAAGKARPGLFDAALQPKPAFHAVANALVNAPRR